MTFYAEIKGEKIDDKALWAIIGQQGICVTNTGNRVFVYGEISPYALGWVLDRCSWFGEVGVAVPAQKLPVYTGEN